MLNGIIIKHFNLLKHMGEVKSKPCVRGCGTLIYFDESRKTDKGKWIPLEVDTKEPHNCPNNPYNQGGEGGGGGQQVSLSSSTNKRLGDLEERVTKLEEANGE